MNAPSDGRPGIVFDVGNVLVRWDMRGFFAKLIESPRELDWFLANVVTTEWHERHDAGHELTASVAGRKALFPDHAALIDAYATRFVETIPGPVPGMHGLVERLLDAGNALFALTNFAAEFWEEFAPTQPVFARFRSIVVSGQEKLVKPNPAIFRLAARRFGHMPGRLLLIDDRPENVAAARREGWRAHLFTGAPALEAELERRGLLRAQKEAPGIAAESP